MRIADVALREMRLLKIRTVSGICLGLTIEKEKCDYVWVKEKSVIISGRKSLRECWEMVINMHAHVYVGREIIVCGLV